MVWLAGAAAGRHAHARYTLAMFDPTTLARAVETSGPLFLRFLDGFTEETWCVQSKTLVNHAAWTVGHLALTMQRAADRVEGFDASQQLPASDWVHGDGTAGDPSRYDTESVSFGSTPQSDRSKYPRIDRAKEIFNGSTARLSGVLSSANVEALKRETPWGSSPIAVGDLALRIVFHNGTHTGQLIDLRRALGMPKALG